MAARALLLSAALTVGALLALCRFFTAPLPEAQGSALFYSNQCRDDLKQLFCQAIQSAKQSIWLSMYAVTDVQIRAQLAKRAAEGIHTTVLYDQKATGSLAIEGATLEPIHSKGLMHRKLLVVDDELVLIGSANLTTSSLRLHDNLVLGLRHKELASFLKSSHSSWGRFALAGQELQMWMLPDPTAYEHIVQQIQQASESITLAMFTLTHEQIVQALIAAQQRGVKVRVLADFYAARGASKKALKQLRASGMCVAISTGQELLHHKWALIDEHTLIFGSANWTAAAFKKNHDCLLILSPLLPKQGAFMRKLTQALYAESSDAG